MLEPNARCSGCNKQIRWMHTEGKNGGRKAMPVNVQPDKHRGNMTANGDVVVVLTLGQAAGARANGVELYTSHFIDCPHAKDFRGRKASGR